MSLSLARKLIVLVLCGVQHEDEDQQHHVDDSSSLMETESGACFRSDNKQISHTGQESVCRQDVWYSPPAVSLPVDYPQIHPCRTLGGVNNLSPLGFRRYSAASQPREMAMFDCDGNSRSDAINLYRRPQHRQALSAQAPATQHEIEGRGHQMMEYSETRPRNAPIHCQQRRHRRKLCNERGSYDTDRGSVQDSRVEAYRGEDSFDPDICNSVPGRGSTHTSNCQRSATQWADNQQPMERGGCNSAK